MFSVLNDYRLNYFGKKIHKKIIVMESDDWGSIRVPSSSVYEMLSGKNSSFASNPFNRFDSLESADDLEALFNVLRNFKDKNGSSPIMTANFIMANPDFDKIRSGNFEHYFFEDFTDTYLRSPATANSIKVVRQGVGEGIFAPQLHGREHLNAARWLKYLAMGDKHLLLGFDHNVFCIDFPIENRRSNLMASLDFNSLVEKIYTLNQLEDSVALFKNIFRDNPVSFIAPCNVWDTSAEQLLSTNGVRYIQGLSGRLIPQLGESPFKRKNHTTGERNKFGQTYLVRNAYFEPATDKTYSWIKRCIEKIEAAFFWGNPAIISTHRVNYIGSLSLANRSENLRALNELLKAILRQWPDVEFMSSNQLGDYYQSKCAD